MNFNRVLVVVISLFGLKVQALVNIPKLQLPPDFQFGCATAAYQIEGAWNQSGRGESTWDYYAHLNPSPIDDQTTGDIACDSYHKYKDDVEMLKDLGVHLYRFSISWSRILPTGFADTINLDGINYYNNLINELLLNNIEPFVTIFHWDLPQRLADLGGWTNPLMEDYFYDYAKICFQYFGDRVKLWTTFNEPWTICVDGYENSRAPPGVDSKGIGSYLCGHTILKSHAKVYHMYQNEFKDHQNGNLTLIVNGAFGEPKTNKSEDIEAANKAYQFQMGWFSHPIFSKDGNYPPEMITAVAERSKEQNFPRSRLPEFTPEEIELIKGSADFFGVNYYTSRILSPGPKLGKKPPSYDDDMNVNHEIDPSWETSDIEWLFSNPKGFETTLMAIKNLYNNPVVYVTENGFVDKEMNDLKRIRYFDGYLQSMASAIKKGCNVKAYITWSLMDNFEWASGYKFSFGLYYVNFSDPSRPRIPRSSVGWLKKFIAAHSNNV